MRRDDGSRGKDGGHVAELLDAYRTGELDTSLRAEVETHLDRCDACREELAELGSWTDAIERGYAAGRAAAPGREPDWAAQRAAIVARTSGRAARARAGRGFRRWAPQVALVAVAALIVGVVWRENAREPAGVIAPPARSGPAADAPGRGGDVAGIESRVEAAQGAEGIGSGAQANRVDRPDAPAPADDRFAAEAPAALGKAVVREREAAPEEDADEGRLERQEALADRAAERSLAAPLYDDGRFAIQARAALAARDTVAARRALALFDSLAPSGGAAGERAALADSLEALLAGGE